MTTATAPPIRLAPPSAPAPQKPGRPPAWPLFPRGHYTSTPPDEPDPHAIAFIRNAVGDKRLAELLTDGIAESEAVLERLYQNSQAGYDLCAVLCEIVRKGSNHRIWLAHLEIVKNPPKAKPQTVVVGTLELLTDVLAKGRENVRESLEFVRDESRNKLSAAGAELDGLRDVLANEARFFTADTPPGDKAMDTIKAVQALGFPIPAEFYRGHHRFEAYPERAPYDLAHTQVSKALATQREMRARLEALNKLETEIHAVLLATIREAVDREAGPEALATSLVDALMLSAETPPSTKEVRAIFTAAVKSLAEKTEIRDQLNRLGIDGNAVQKAEAAITEADVARKKARDQFAAVCRIYAAEAVTRSLAADRQALDAIAKLSGEHPDMFRSGTELAKAFRSATFNSSALQVFRSVIGLDNHVKGL